MQLKRLLKNALHSASTSFTDRDSPLMNGSASLRDRARASAGWPRVRNSWRHRKTVAGFC